MVFLAIPYTKGFHTAWKSSSDYFRGLIWGLRLPRCVWKVPDCVSNHSTPNSLPATCRRKEVLLPHRPGSNLHVYSCPSLGGYLWKNAVISHQASFLIGSSMSVMHFWFNENLSTWLTWALSDWPHTISDAAFVPSSFHCSQSWTLKTLDGGTAPMACTVTPATWKPPLNKNKIKFGNNKTEERDREQNIWLSRSHL